MEDLLSAIAAIFLWRIVLTCIAMLLAAVLIGLLVPGLTAPLVFSAFVLGPTLGIVWHARADTASSRSSQQPADPVKLHPATVALAFVVIGLFWSGILSVLLGTSWLAIPLIGGSPFLLGPLLSRLTGEAVTRRGMTIASVGLTIGGVVPLLLAR